MRISDWSSDVCSSDLEVNESGGKVIKHELWDANAIEKIDDLTVRLNLKAPQLAVPEHLFHYPAVMPDPAEDGVFGLGANGTGASTRTEIAVPRRAQSEERRAGKECVTTCRSRGA